MHPLKQSFYNRETLEVAPDLLGKYLIREINGHKLIVKIVEVEAYKGAIDKGAHSYKYKHTPRTEVMFGPPGHAYIYLIYGMYYCLNIVTEEEGEPCAILIRGVEPIKGDDYMSLLRYQKPLSEITPTQLKNLSNGPGKLCKSLCITKEQNRHPVWKGELYITSGVEITPEQIIRSKRINIDYAEEAKDFLWRFSIKGNPYVSVKPIN